MISTGFLAEFDFSDDDSQVLANFRFLWSEASYIYSCGVGSFN
jgi:hypothetical protein